MLVPYTLTFVQLFLLTKCTMNESLEDTFRQCLISQVPSNLGHCLGVGAISRLQSLDGDPEFDIVDGVTLTKDVQEYRDAYNFAEGDPNSIRSIFDSFGYVFSRRNLKWNMNFLYPGLMMHVAPSAHPGGTLEFILDPHREAINVHSLKEAGTGRLLARQFLLPFLLGFKFNVISFIPIIFGLIALIAKKALILSKVALVMSSAFALGSLLFGNVQGYPSQYYTTGTNGGHYGHFGHGAHGGHGGHGLHGGHGGLGGHGHFGHQGHGGFHGYTKFPEEDYSDSLFKETNEATADQLNVFPNVVKSEDIAARTDKKKGRNFAWNEDEKKIMGKLR